MRLRTFLSAACALSAALIAPRAIRAQAVVHFSGAAAVAVPVGDLGNATDVGYSLALRGEGRLPWENLSVRGDLTWDRFAGRGAVDSYSYLGAAANLVHRSRTSRLYEFVGPGLYGARTSFNNQVNNDGMNLGVQTGVGIDLAPNPHSPFIEFGVTNVWTSGTNTLWFPVRFGVRF